ncbi:MAG: Probable Co/Zn/Cd efflux system membrane fusion protein, partial [uncultured Acetobacteraceae bacterium]
GSRETGRPHASSAPLAVADAPPVLAGLARLGGAFPCPDCRWRWQPSRPGHDGAGEGRPLAGRGLSQRRGRLRIRGSRPPARGRTDRTGARGGRADGPAWPAAVHAGHAPDPRGAGPAGGNPRARPRPSRPRPIGRPALPVAPRRKLRLPAALRAGAGGRVGLRRHRPRHRGADRPDAAEPRIRHHHRRDRRSPRRPAHPRRQRGPRRRKHVLGHRHPGGPGARAVRGAGALARGGQGGDGGRRAHRPRPPRPAQRAGGRGRAGVRGQLGGHQHRHHPAQGALPQPRPAALARPVRAGHAGDAAGGGHVRVRVGGADRAAGAVRFRAGAGRHRPPARRGAGAHGRRPRRGARAARGRREGRRGRRAAGDGRLAGGGAGGAAAGRGARPARLDGQPV